MKRPFGIVLAAAIILPLNAAASVRPGALPAGADPNWPCIQRKVPELSVVSFWAGPPVDEAMQRWQQDLEIAALVVELIARRMPVDEASAAVRRFAQSQASETKNERLTLLFAGVFETLDRERSEIIAGIERYGRKQKEMAERIRGDMRQAGDPAVTSSGPQATELQNRLLWQTRIFNERRASLSFVCEVPTLIEQRLFELARAIGRELPS